MLDLDNTYVTSDLHLWHKNIIKYCNRPYELTDDGVSKMNEDLLQQIDNLPKGSTLINNGDVLMGCKSWIDIQKAILRMKQNDKKLILIMGNHDRELNKNLKDNFLKFSDSKEIFECAGFDFVSPFPILINNNLLFSHEPVTLSEDSPIFNIHGHTHDNNCNWESNGFDLPENKYINVCWDNIHRIISLKEIVEMTNTL